MKTSNQTKITSVYRNQNVLIRAVFERAGDTRKVLCVALDYATPDGHFCVVMPMRPKAAARTAA